VKGGDFMSKKQEGGEKGRKSKYFTHVLPRMDAIKAMMRNGATLEILSQKLNVSVSALSEYKNRFPEFKEALIISGEIADMTIENAFYDMAKVDKWAAFTWLKNRQPKRWRDKQHIFQQSTVTQRKDYENMTDEELEKEEAMLEDILPGDEFNDMESDGEIH
jgi:hypothetical protein